MRYRGERRGRAWRLGLVLLPILTTQAEAHTTIKGADEFVNGFLHPLFTPTHLLLLFALGLWLGQNPPLRLKIPLLAFAPLSAVGVAITATGAATGIGQPVLIVPALCAGVLVAAATRLPGWGQAVLSGAAALALGLDSAAENATTSVALAKTLFATWVSLNAWFISAAFYVALCPSQPWVRIGLRVVGSWIVAISVLVLAFSLRK